MAKAKDGQKDVRPTADSIAASVRAASRGKGLPPVDKWHPERETDSRMRIAADGTWFHEGTPINRAELVRLFSTILRRDGDAYFLVTPAEKARVEVEDAPFIAVDFEVSGEGEAQVLTFLTNVGDRVEAGPDHAIRVERANDTGEPAPYIEVRGGLEARIDRKSFYRLVEEGTRQDRDGEAWFGVVSGGTFFPFIPAKDMDAG